LTDWRGRFARFVERKTRDAETAALQPFATVSQHVPRNAVAIGNAWSRRLFDGNFYLSPVPDERAGCSLVFVRTRDGNTGADDPSTLGGGETDKHLIYEGLSRVAADGVLAGAETIRSADLILSVWHPELVALRASIGLPRHPVQIVATLRGLDLDATLLFNVPDVPVVILAPAAAERALRGAVASRSWVTLVVMRDRSALPDAFAALRRRGIARVSSIGGHTIATQLIDAGLVQDAYVTTSPLTGGEPDTPIYPRPLPGHSVLKKQGTGREAGVAFDHIHLR